MKADKSHCFMCFDALDAHLKKDASSFPRLFEPEANKVPLFVTWKIDQKLRGCIGNLSPQPFPQGLAMYAVEAGCKDSRFAPMNVDDFKVSTCGVSLLVDFEPNLRWDDWEVGTHGIVIKFNGSFKAIFLPEVAKDQGWSKKATLEHLVRKAGYDGKCDQKLLDSIRLERFVSSKAEASYDEWFQTKVEVEINKRNKTMADW